AAAAAPTAGPLRKVRMALAFVGTETLPVHIALDQGIYRKYGLDVETISMQSSAQVAPAMAAGDIDIALTAGAGAVDIDLAGGNVEAAMLAPPFDLFAEREGFPLLVDTKNYRIPYMQGALAVRRGILADRYELVRDVVRAHLEGLAAARRDPTLAKRILVEEM